MDLAVTELLGRLRDGDPQALDQLIPLVYGELTLLAQSNLRRHRRSPTLNTSDLVHEAYMKMAGQEGLDATSQGHFLGIAARAMRQVIVAFARARTADKRGGGCEHITLEQQQIPIDDYAPRLLEIDEVLSRLGEHDPRLATVVECRFFAGLTEDETAAAMGSTLRTVQRDWSRARIWLRRLLAEEES
ncbi:RNA polymerase subunit sigma-70 [bacterium]|nr:RNA polymerase subunit sigma-70 [bacterium]